MPPKDRLERLRKGGGWNQFELIPTSFVGRGMRSFDEDSNMLERGPFKVQFYEGKGVALSTPKVGNPSGSNGGVTARGKVGGFSLKSRGKMRRDLLTTRPKDARLLCAVTLTVPGPPLTRKEKDKVWHVWRNRLVRMNVGLKWRMEKQSRGAVHWHGLAAVPASLLEPNKNWGVGDTLLPEVLSLSQPRFRFNRKTGYQDMDFGHMERFWSWNSVGAVSAFAELLHAWHAAIDSVGPVSISKPGYPVGSVVFRSEWPQFGATSVFVPDVCDDNEFGWMRYLQDHCTKSKRDQVCFDFGRHWGVINKDAFVSVLPDSVVALTDKEYFRFLRCFQRLTTPRIRCELAPFGRKLGYRNRRGQCGTSYWFSRPETVQRIVEWAVGQ